MEAKDFPYPLGVKEHVVLTEDEKKTITATLDAGWKEFCSLRHDILGMRAKMVILRLVVKRSIEQPQPEPTEDNPEPEPVPPKEVKVSWNNMTSDERYTSLKASGIDVPLDWIADGWPLHGQKSKLIKFSGPLTRKGWAVRASGFTEERQKQILKHLHVLDELDREYMTSAKNVENQIERLMSNAPKPKSKAELIAALDGPVDYDYYVTKYMETVVNKNHPTWKEFAAKYKDNQIALPVEEKTLNPPMDL